MHAYNRLLAALSPALRAQIQAVARTVSLQQGEVLNQPQQRARHVYFITSGVISFVVTGREGGSAEIGVVGCEGLVGSADLLGSYAPDATCLVQMAGSAHRVSVRDMQAIFDSSPEFRSLLLQATQQQLLSVAQIAACNRLHSATQRLARWLLTTADRGGSETVHLTQDAISHMLGTRRTTVALIAATLQRSGFIRYARGTAEIVDRPGLETTTCECYRITRRLVDKLYDNPFYKE